MQGSEFRKWAESSYRSYGSDPWFFIRELAQNSRDAGAKCIRTKVEYTPKSKETLTFEDNGCGMSYEHAKKFLFRLYATSKTSEKFSAGMYGAGFWTILQYKPQNIIIESNNGKEKWAVLLNLNLGVIKTICKLKKPGTRITLIREAQFKSQNEFQNTVQKALLRYCIYMRKNNKKANILPVFFQDENITQPIQLPGPVAISFKHKHVEGAIGLGNLPKVSLYARGLPVWEGTTLEELSHTYSPKITNYEIGHGLAPIFLLNGNNLDVNISRNYVIDNRELKKLRETAKQKLSKLVRIYADRVFPRNIFIRIVDSINSLRNSLNRSFWKIFLLALLIILPIEFLILNKIYIPKKKSGTTQSILQVNKNQYSGATVKYSSNGIKVDINYKPPVNTLFKMFTADRYNTNSGFIRDTKNNNLLLIHQERKEKDVISVQIRIPKAGKIFLPQPAKYIIDSNSLTLNNKPLLPLKLNSNGEAIVTIPEKGGLIEYKCFPYTQREYLNPDETSRLTKLPKEIKIPLYINQKLMEFSKLNINTRINKALNLTSTILKYDNSAQIAAKYNISPKSTDWLSKVLQIKKGDCDVLNGVYVLFLRRIDIPSRLVIGFIGRNGQILPGLHAWTEYFNNGWHITDASQITTLDTNTNNESYNNYPTTPRASTPIYYEARTKKTKNLYLIYILITIILFLFLIFFISLVLKIKRKKEIDQKQDINQIKETIVQIAIRATLQPDIWGYDSNIWNYRIIPTVNKKYISLKWAFKLSKNGKLFIGHKNNPIVKQFKKSRVLVLDPENNTFSSLIHLLPGKVNLDIIDALKATLPEQVKNNNISRLLEYVNRILKKITGDSNICLFAPGLKNQDFMDVNLPTIPYNHDMFFPNKFIAINPEGEKIKTLNSLFQQNAQLAIYRTIKSIFQESRIFSSKTKIILNKTSILLLKEIQ